MDASLPGESKVVQNVGSGVRDPGSVSRPCHPQSVWLSASPSDPVPWFSHLQNGTVVLPSSEGDGEDGRRQVLLHRQGPAPSSPCLIFVVIALEISFQENTWVRNWFTAVGFSFF